MAVQTVACPGCKATLKAPEQMAGKKAKCKKCGVSFRIPGGAEPTGDSASDSQFLSAMDLPVPAAGGDNPFDFGGEPEPESKPVEKPAAKKPAAIPKAEPAAPVKAAAKLPPPKPGARKPKVEDEEIPAAAPVEDDEPVATASSDPFSFSGKPGSKSQGQPVEEKKSKKKEPTGGVGAFAFGDDPTPGGLTDEPDEEEDEDAEPVVEKSAEKKVGKRGYATKGGGGGGGSGKLIIAAVVFGLIVAGGIGGAIIYTKKGPEQAANNDKKNPDPVMTTTPVEPAPTPPGKGETPKAADPKEKEKDKATPKKEPIGKKNTGGGPMLVLGASKGITFLPPSAKPESIQKADNRLMIVPALPAGAADAFSTARKVFPPLKRDIDIGVIWQTEKDLQGVGEKLFLGIYSPQNGKQANKVECEGDGSPVPVCDLSVDANLFAHAHIGQGKVNVWDTRTGMKIVDGFNPYANAKKEYKLAAVFLTEPPLVFITVSTTGAVHAFNVKSKEQMPGEFVPTRTSGKPLVAGKHIALGPNRVSVVVFSGGSFYSVNIGPTVDGREVVRLDGDVGRSFGIAGSGGGKLLFAFETDDSGKKEKAVMDVRPDGSHVLYRWPDKDAGEPTTVGWVGDDLAMIGTDRGSCVWFDAEGKNFKPIGLARTPNEKGRHVASDGHWTLLPDPANAKQCVLVEYAKPQSGIVGALEDAKQPPTVLLTDTGLSK